MCILALFIIKSNLLDINIVPRPFYNLFLKKVLFSVCCTVFTFVLGKQWTQIMAQFRLCSNFILIYIMFYQDIPLLKKVSQCTFMCREKNYYENLPKNSSSLILVNQ